MVVNPRQMFHPVVPRRKSRKRPLSPTFIVRLGILYRTHGEQSHDELCVKQRTITTQTRLIVPMARTSSASLSFQKTPSKPCFSRLSPVRVSPLTAELIECSIDKTLYRESTN